MLINFKCKYIYEISSFIKLWKSRVEPDTTQNTYLHSQFLILYTPRYASQEAWIFAGSLRQNVLFGQPYEAERYSKVIKACALDHDLQKFEHGDLTLVGERGVSLSGKLS